jgi:hypothetical protein
MQFATKQLSRMREEPRRKWLFRAVAAASILFAGSSAVALLLYRSANEQAELARQQKMYADEQAAGAREQARAAVANESRALTAFSRVALDDRQVNQAAQLALAAWPRNDDHTAHQLVAGVLQ